MKALLIDVKYAAGWNSAGAGCDVKCSLIPLGGWVSWGWVYSSPPFLSEWDSMKLGIRFTLCWKKSNWLQTLASQVVTNSKNTGVECECISATCRENMDSCKHELWYPFYTEAVLGLLPGQFLSSSFFHKEPGPGSKKQFRAGPSSMLV